MTETKTFNCTPNRLSTLKAVQAGKVTILLYAFLLSRPASRALDQFVELGHVVLRNKVYELTASGVELLAAWEVK